MNADSTFYPCFIRVHPWLSIIGLGCRTIITLTTDFGTSNHYAGTMKGVILGIAPSAANRRYFARSPALRSYDGAFTISQAYPYFPKKTIHVVVVTQAWIHAPTAARGMAGQYFIAPDNGVLSMISRGRRLQYGTSRQEIFPQSAEPNIPRPRCFCSVAAHLAAGVLPGEIRPTHR